MSKFSFSNQAGMRSSPVALVLFKLASFLLTDISETLYVRIFSIDISSRFLEAEDRNLLSVLKMSC